jgi:DNA-binding CsgD family transcriptional regulator
MQIPIEWRAMRHAQSVLQLVDGIYAAACAERPWEQTLAEICQVGDLEGCVLSAVDPLERRRGVLASWGLNPDASPHAMLDPIGADPELPERILRSTPGAVWHDRQIMSGDRSDTTGLGADRRPRGSMSRACLVVGRDGREVVCLEAYAGAGHASSGPEMGDLLRQLAPHLTRAWCLGRASRSKLARHDASPPRSPTRAAPAPDLAGLPAVARLRAEFGLTKAEARLALRVADGSSLASAAQAFDVKLTTIRSQLQQVFAKTGTSRQTELVAMLLSCGYRSGGPLWQPLQRAGHAAALAERGL